MKEKTEHMGLVNAIAGPLETVTIEHFIIHTHSARNVPLVSGEGKKVFQLELFTKEHGRISGMLPFNPTHRDGWLPGDQQVLQIIHAEHRGQPVVNFKMPPPQADFRRPVTIGERVRLLEEAVQDNTVLACCLREDIAEIKVALADLRALVQAFAEVMTEPIPDGEQRRDNAE